MEINIVIYIYIYIYVISKNCFKQKQQGISEAVFNIDDMLTYCFVII